MTRATMQQCVNNTGQLAGDATDGDIFEVYTQTHDGYLVTLGWLAMRYGQWHIFPRTESEPASFFEGAPRWQDIPELFAEDLVTPSLDRENIATHNWATGVATLVEVWEAAL